MLNFVRRRPLFGLDPSPLGVEFRPFQHRRDNDLVAELARALAADAAGPRPTEAGLVAETASRPGRSVETWLATGVERPEPLGFVIRVTGCGSARVRHSIAWLVVHPAARRRGVGRGLVSLACRQAHELGASEVWAASLAQWPNAIAFWQANGFKEHQR